MANEVGAPVLEPGHTYRSITDKIASVVLRGTTLRWFAGFFLAFMILMVFLISVTVLFFSGVGIWGINIPVAWGFAIVNFVWWIGIGHAGTLISAILLLMHQKWRTSINRFAEAMTLFAIVCAASFPLLHLGRPWLAYWLIPYPNQMTIQPQFRSPLVWDFFAISTYGTVSLLFWYLGLIPDLATLRDRARSRFAKVFYGIFALGWRGSAFHWQRYEITQLLFAGLATPLVVSVHSIVSLDFAVAILPGWHSTIFPPYFVAVAIYSGFAMVISIAVPLRKFYGLDDFITQRHLENMAKIMLATGLIVAYGYVIEAFISWYSGDVFERFLTINRALGPYAKQYWVMIFFNVIAPQLLWFAPFRKKAGLLFLVALFVNAGMWMERYIIVITSLHRDYMPSAWGMFHATGWDWSTFIGSLGLFLTLLYLFIRILPMISITEMKKLLTETEEAAAV